MKIIDPISVPWPTKPLTPAERKRMDELVSKFKCFVEQSGLIVDTSTLVIEFKEKEDGR